MNRAERHIILVMAEQMHKKSKRDLQRFLASKNLCEAKSINALIKALNKAEMQYINNTVEVIVKPWR